MAAVGTQGQKLIRESASRDSNMTVSSGVLPALLSDAALTGFYYLPLAGFSFTFAFNIINAESNNTILFNFKTKACVLS